MNKLSKVIKTVFLGAAILLNINKSLAQTNSTLLKLFEKVVDYSSHKPSATNKSLENDATIFMQNLQRASTEEREIFYRNVSSKMKNASYNKKFFETLLSKYKGGSISNKKQVEDNLMASLSHGNTSISPDSFKNVDWASLSSITTIQQKLRTLGFKEVHVNKKMDEPTKKAIREILNDQSIDFNKKSNFEIDKLIDDKIQEKFHLNAIDEPESKITMAIPDENGNIKAIEISDKDVLKNQIANIENNGFKVKEICIDLENKTASVILKCNNDSGGSTLVGLNTSGHADISCITKEKQKLKVNFEKDGGVSITASDKKESKSLDILEELK